MNLTTEFNYCSAVSRNYGVKTREITIIVVSFQRRKKGVVSLARRQEVAAKLRQNALTKPRLNGKFARWVLFFNPFLPTVPTFAVRETSVSRIANVETVGKNRLRMF